MKCFSRPILIGMLVSGGLLVGHALYFGDRNVALGDGLIFLAMVACWGFLLKQTGASGKASENAADKPGAATAENFQFIQESNAFHVQLGNEMSGQLSSAHTELGNTQAILSDAITKLVSNFITISDGVRDLSEHTGKFGKQVRQLTNDVRSTLASSEHYTSSHSASDDPRSAEKSNQHVKAMLTDFAAFNEMVNQNALELNEISSRVEQNVLVVISTLQFQDMSSQLIEHARMRMTALQEIANEMGRGANSDSLSHREYLTQIAAYNRLLQKHVLSLDKEKANPVAQKSFGTGEIDLF